MNLRTPDAATPDRVSTPAVPTERVGHFDNDPGRWWALVVVCLAQFMVVLDATITNVALPTIQDALKVSDSNLQWIINSYTLAFGGFLLLGGRMSDLLGRRLIFVIGTIIFSLASLMNGLAWDETSLIVFRGLQGLGAALTSPAALSVIMTSFAEGPERGKALGVWSGIAAGGAAFGLLLGGVITELLDWRWIFFINVPVGIIVVLLAFRRVHESRAELGHRSFDILGAVLVTSGLMTLVYAIVKSSTWGFTDVKTIGLTVLALALLGSFLVAEYVQKAPLVRLGLLKLRSLTIANIAMMLVPAGMFAFFFFATLYVQNVLGYKPIKAGLAFLPFTVGIGFGATLAQMLMKRLGVKWTAVVGLVIDTCGLLYMLHGVQATGGTYLELLPGILILSFGMGLTFVPFTLVATTNVGDQEAGLASGIFNTSQQIGGALGLAILSTVATNAMKDKGAALGKVAKAAADKKLAPILEAHPGAGVVLQHPNSAQAKQALASDPQLAGILAQLKGATPSAAQKAVMEHKAMVEGFHQAFVWGAGFMVAALIVHLVFLRPRDIENIDVDAPIMPAA